MTSLADRDVIIAVDPGETTGWACWWRNPETHTGDILGWGEDDQMEFLKKAEQMLEAWGTRVEVVCEAFVITQETAKKTAAPWSLEILGTLRYLAHKHGAAFHTYTAAAAKTFSSNDKLKRISWYRPGKGHATDAHRHLLLRVVERGLVQPRLVVE